LIVLGAIVAVTFFFFYQSFEKPKEEGDPLRAIPANAALVLKSDDIGEIWRSLTEKNLIWEKLLVTDYFFRLNEVGQNLDSLIRRDAQLRGLLNGQSMVISAHLTGREEYDFLYAIQLDTSPEDQNLVGVFQKTFKLSNENTRSYDNQTISSYESPLFDDRIFIAILEQTVVVSFSEVLLEESIRAYSYQGDLASDASFVEVNKTVNSSAIGHLYLKYPPFKTILKGYLSKVGRRGDFFEQSYADWTAMDLTMGIDELSLNGFTLAKDSSKSWLAPFANQAPPQIELYQYLPSQTASFQFLGFGDFDQFMKEKGKMLDKNGDLFRYEKKIVEYDDLCNCNSQKLGLSWISTQAISFVTEPSSKDFAQNRLAIFLASDGETALEQLVEFQSSLGAEEPSSEEGIFKLEVGNFYSDLLGSTFSGLSNPYVARVEDAIVLANSRNAMRNYLNTLIGGRTFVSSTAYASLEPQLFDDANYVVFSSVAKSPYIYQNLISSEYEELVGEKTELLRDFESFVYQVSHSTDDLFYTSTYLKQGSNYTQETGALWELALKSNVKGVLHPLKNHYTGATEALVQDEDNRLYLISHTGKVIWEKQIDEPIVGEVKQIDVYKNDKLQMLFSTANAIHVLDRNGNKVEFYPVSLPSAASAEVNFADYDNSRDYRIFIPTENGKILCYDAYGKPIEGWEYESKNGKLIVPIQHLRIKKKDYLFTLSSEGKVLLLDRRGGIRHSVKEEATDFMKGLYALGLGPKISQSSFYYANSEGSAVRLGFDDTKENFQPAQSQVIDYAFGQFGSSSPMDFAFLHEENLSAYTFEGDVLFEVELDNEPSVLSYHSGKKGGFFSATCEADELIYLFSLEGNPIPGFPVIGNGKPIIADINLDGYLEMITTGKEGKVYAYSIEQE
jgi:hypothetical protein